jgi:hypothetical protein
MGMRSRKAEVRELLVRRDRSAVETWIGEVRNPDRLVVSLTYDNDELIRFRAIEAVGWVAGQLARESLEKVRDNLRRLFWLMNDESGGLGWHAPEVVGEILVNVPELIVEYAHRLPSLFAEEPFERGSHFAVCRIATVDTTPFRSEINSLRISLTNTDPHIRLYAALGLIRMGQSAGTGLAEKLLDDSTPLTTYDFDSGELVKIKVGDSIRQELRSAEAGSPVERG